MILSTPNLGNYGAVVYSAHAGFGISTVAIIKLSKPENPHTPKPYILTPLNPKPLNPKP